MITIRRFTPTDQAHVSGLISEIMNEEFQTEKTAYPTEDIDNIEESYGNLGEAFFVAISGNKVVGTVAIKKEDHRVALLRRLFVATPYRKQQIGARLVERALQFCREVGYEEIVFKTTSRMERANQLCEKSGFVPRAKLQLGSLSLLKLTLSLRDDQKVPRDGHKVQA